MEMKVKIWNIKIKQINSTKKNPIWASRKNWQMWCSWARSKSSIQASKPSRTASRRKVLIDLQKRAQTMNKYVLSELRTMTWQIFKRPINRIQTYKVAILGQRTIPYLKASPSPRISKKRRSLAVNRNPRKGPPITHSTCWIMRYTTKFRRHKFYLKTASRNEFVIRRRKMLLTRARETSAWNIGTVVYQACLEWPLQAWPSSRHQMIKEEEQMITSIIHFVVNR